PTDETRKLSLYNRLDPIFYAAVKYKPVEGVVMGSLFLSKMRETARVNRRSATMQSHSWLACVVPMLALSVFIIPPLYQTFFEEGLTHSSGYAKGVLKDSSLSFQRAMTCSMSMHTGLWVRRLSSHKCRVPQTTFAYCDDRVNASFNSGQRIPRRLADSSHKRGLPAAWAWPKQLARKCGVQSLDHSNASRLLQDKWIALVGDSVTRFLYAAFLRLLTTTGDEQIRFRHQSFEHEMPCNVRLSFTWAPYPENITAQVEDWQATGMQPDALILGGGLWPILHIGRAELFRAEINILRQVLLR
ncbi:hypothetical protein CYMTET_28926, partial [Cymbomonas tetramitiformis]